MIGHEPELSNRLIHGAFRGLRSCRRLVDMQQDGLSTRVVIFPRYSRSPLERIPLGGRITDPTRILPLRYQGRWEVPLLHCSIGTEIGHGSMEGTLGYGNRAPGTSSQCARVAYHVRTSLPTEYLPLEGDDEDTVGSECFPERALQNPPLH